MSEILLKLLGSYNRNLISCNGVGNNIYFKIKGIALGQKSVCFLILPEPIIIHRPARFWVGYLGVKIIDHYIMGIINVK